MTGTFHDLLLLPKSDDKQGDGQARNYGYIQQLSVEHKDRDQRI